MPTQPKKTPASPRRAKAAGATPPAPTIDFAPLEAWFVTGSQHLYGPETLAQVEADARQIVAGLNDAGLPIRLVFKPVVKTPEEIRDTLVQASADPACIGVVTWMHTFSPAKMWIGGLTRLTKPLCHLHTQFGRDIPWSSIDMDFMNLNQSAHGDREFGHICARLRIARKVIVGHWKEKGVTDSLSVWLRAAAGLAELRRHQGRPHRRQHAPGGGHRGRQGRGRDRLRHVGQRLRHGRRGRASRTRSPTPRSTGCAPNTTTATS